MVRVWPLELRGVWCVDSEGRNPQSVARPVGHWVRAESKTGHFIWRTTDGPPMAGLHLGSAMMSMQRTGENGSPTTSSDPMQSALATALANQILAQQQQQQQQQSGQSMQMQVPLSPNGQGQSGMTVSDAELKRQKRYGVA